jgi:hypothetical protein
MNLRQIDEFLERHSAGWKPFKQMESWFRSATKVGGGNLSDKVTTLMDSLAQATLPHDPLSLKVTAAASGFASDKAHLRNRTTLTNAEDAAGGAAAAAAAIRQAEFEASAKAGMERIALRRKRGFGQSMIVNPGSTLGTSSTLGS